MSTLDWYGRAIGLMITAFGVTTTAIAFLAPSGTDASAMRFDGVLSVLAGWALWRSSRGRTE